MNEHNENSEQSENQDGENIEFSITFLDFWHLSSGLSGGARLDNLVVRDEMGFCFVPAKTLKGVLSELAVEMQCPAKFLQECFGDATHAAKCHFSNAVLGDATKKELKNQHLLPLLYAKIAATAIDEDTGSAKEGTLRQIEVAKPLTLGAKILKVPQQHASQMKNLLKSLKRMGLNRNKGLGRLKIEILEGQNA